MWRLIVNRHILYNTKNHHNMRSNKHKRSTVRPTGLDETRDLRATGTPLVNLDPILTQESFDLLLLFYVLETM